MTKPVRVVDGLVVEILVVPDGFALADVYPPDILDRVVQAPDTIEPNWTYDGQSFAAPVVAERAPADLTAYAAQARYAKEIGGIAVGNARIDTSRESRSMVADAWDYMVQSGLASTQYKTDSGWVTVSADQMKSIALAVGAHVQACFAAEADLDAKITAGTITTTAQIDAAFAALAT